MRRLAAALLFALAGVLIFPASVSAGSVKAAKSVLCEDCDVFIHGVHRKVIPTDDFVCVFFVQRVRDNVMLRLDLKDGTTRRYDRKNAKTVDRICVGRHWVRSSLTMYICNGENHADYNVVDTQSVAVKPKFSRNNEACLLGSAECGKRGYKTKR